jgi:hypothetical protein
MKYSPAHFLSKNKAPFLVLGLFLFLAINEAYWLAADNTPLIWDECDHLSDSLRYYHALLSLDFGKIISIQQFYPPLAPLAAIPGYLLFGKSADVGVFFENMPFLFILLFSTYYLGKYVKDENTGLLASFLVGTSPMVYGQARTFMLDLPLLSMVSLSLLILVKTKKFTDTRHSLILGCLFGLGQLTKWTYALFLIAPLIYAAILALKEWISSQRNKQARNLILAIGLGIIIASVFYVPNCKQIAANLLGAYFAGDVEGDPQGITPVYIKYLINIQYTFIYFIYFLLGLAFFLKTKKITGENKLFLLICIFVPFLFFSLVVVNKDPRYTLPLLSAIAIVTSAGVLEIRKKTCSVFLFFLVAAGLTSFFSVSYPEVELPTIYADSPVGKVSIIGYQDSIYSREAAFRDWETDEMIDALIKNSKSYLVRISVLPNNPEVWCPMQYGLLIKGLGFDFRNFRANDSFDESFYVITQAGGFIGVPWEEEFVRARMKEFEAYNNATGNFQLVYKKKLEGDATVLIYRRKGD